MSALRRFLRDNGLTIGFGLLFLAALAGQAVAGQLDFNQQQRECATEYAQSRDHHEVWISTWDATKPFRWAEEFLPIVAG